MARGKADPHFYKANLGKRKELKRTRVTLKVKGLPYWEATGRPHLVKGGRLNRKGTARLIRAQYYRLHPRRSSRH